MSTLPSRRMRVHIELSVALIALLCACGIAQAKQSDKNQPININANAFAGSQDSGKITFTGAVVLDQGTFHADGAQATGYTDPNDTSQWQRVVLTGAPAHFQQTQDNGTLVHGSAQTLDYKVSENTVILTGDATVVQQGRGAYHGQMLAYNTDTGEIQGTAAAGGRVHITLQPRTQPNTVKPASRAPAAASPAARAAAPATGTPAASMPPPATNVHVAPAAAATSGRP